MSKCCTVQLPISGECCGMSQGGEREFTIKVKVQRDPGAEGCRVEISSDNCCGDKDTSGCCKPAK